MSSHSEYMRKWTQRWKAAAHAALGGVCLHCGFTDTRALQIDHVDGDGHVELVAYRSTLGSYYKRVVSLADSGRYQLLCANCNWIKRVERGEHT